MLGSQLQRFAPEFSQRDVSNALNLQEIGSRHRKILKWMPLHDVPAAMFQERRVILYGTRCRETPEDLSEREIRKEIRSVIPDLFGG